MQRPGTASSAYTTASIPFSFSSSLGPFEADSQLEPGTVLHGLFKIKGKTCEVYFDGQNIYWKSVKGDTTSKSNHQFSNQNTPSNSSNSMGFVTSYSNFGFTNDNFNQIISNSTISIETSSQFSGSTINQTSEITLFNEHIPISRIHGVKLKCLKSWRNGEHRKTTVGMALFVLQNDSKTGHNKKFSEAQIILELEDHRICVEWGRQIISSITHNFPERPKSVLILAQKAGIYTVLEQFFNRARINFQFICLEDEILPGDLNSDESDARFNPLWRRVN